MYFNLRDFPKFWRYYSRIAEDKRSWIYCFHDDGFPSVKQVAQSWYTVEMDDDEYTWFVLKWS
jgi:hypothetical protein